MKISDIQRGKSTMVEVQPASADNFGEGVSVLQEVELFFSELESEVLLRIGERSWAVEGSDAVLIHYHRGWIEPEDPFGSDSTEERRVGNYGESSDSKTDHRFQCIGNFL